jgi:hypothetical protein
MFSVDFATCFNQLYDMELNINNFDQSKKLLEAGLSVAQIENELKDNTRANFIANFLLYFKIIDAN